MRARVALMIENSRQNGILNCSPYGWKRGRRLVVAKVMAARAAAARAMTVRLVSMLRRHYGLSQSSGDFRFELIVSSSRCCGCVWVRRREKQRKNETIYIEAA
jgi:hypothetical protein